MPRYIVAKLRNDAAVPIVVQWKENGVDKSAEVDVGKTVVRELVFADGDLRKEVKFYAFALDSDSLFFLLNGNREVILSSKLDRAIQSVVIQQPSRLVRVSFFNHASGPVIVSWTKENVVENIVVRSLFNSTIEFSLPWLSSENVSVKFSATRSDINEVVLVNGLSLLNLSLNRNVIANRITLTDLPRFVISDFANNADGDIVVTWLENDIKKSIYVKAESSSQTEVVFLSANKSHPVTFSARRKDSKESVNLNGSSSVKLFPSKTRFIHEIIATDVPKRIDLTIVNKVEGPVVLVWLLKDNPMAVNLNKAQTRFDTFTVKGVDARRSIEFTARRTDYDLPVNVNKMEKVEIMPQIGTHKHKVVISDRWLVIPWINEGWKDDDTTDEKRYLLVEFFTKVSGPFRLKVVHQGGEKTIDMGTDSFNKVALIFQGSNANMPVWFTGTRTDVDFPVQLNYNSKVELRPKLTRTVDEVIVTDERVILSWIEGPVASLRESSHPEPRKYIMINFVNEAAGPVLITASRGKTESQIDLPYGETTKLSVVLQGSDLDDLLKLTGKRKDKDSVVSFNHMLRALYIPRKEKVIETLTVRDPKKYITLNFINRAVGNVEIAWILNGAQYSSVLRPNDNIRKELVFDGNDRTGNVVFTAIRTSNAAPVQLNSLNSISFKPSLSRTSERVVATDAYKYVIVDLRNEAKEAVVFYWRENREVKSRDVNVGREVSEVIRLIEPFLQDRVHFTAKTRLAGTVVSVNNSSFVEVIPSYEKTTTKVVARDPAESEKLRYLDVTFRNKAPGNIEIFWSENESTRSIEIGEGKTLRKSFSFHGPNYTKIFLSSKFVTSPGIVLLNEARLISLTPSAALSKVFVTASSPHLYLNFKNLIVDTAYTEWINDGTLQKATVVAGSAVNRLVFFDRPGGRFIISGNITSKTMKSVALYNGQRSLQIIEDPRTLSKDIVITRGTFHY